MKSSTNRLSFVFLAAALAVGAVLASGCGTMFGVRMTSPPSWLEGKDYVVQFSMANVEKARKVTLYYRVNSQPIQVVEPRLNGSLREYAIPAAQLQPGRLEYWVIVLDADGKEHKEGESSVTVLSRAEGKAQAERDLARRAQVAAPDEVGVNADFNLILTVARPRGVIEATIYVKDASSSKYKSAPLTATAGEYRYRIPAADLKEGDLSYYFKIAEQNPDFGRLEITYPADADRKPLVARVIGLKEMADRMAAELVQGVTHQPVAEALENADLKITLSLRIPDGGMLPAYLLEPPTVLLLYGRKERSTRFRSLPMAFDGRGTYTAVIDRRSIADGSNSYFFTISAQTKDVGPIDVVYPPGGQTDPLVYRIVSLQEMRDRLMREYSGKLGHTPPARASQVEPLTLAVTLTPDARAAAAAVLHYKRNTRDRSYRDVSMQFAGDSFKAVVQPDDLPDNLLIYYFTVSLAFPDVGEVRIDIPRDGASQPFTVPVEDKKATEARLKADLARRVHHVRLTEAKDGTDTEVAVTVDAMKTGTEATLYLKAAGERSVFSKKMTARGNRLTAVIGKADLKQGYNQYYIEVEEPHPYFHGLVVTLPEGGRDKPWDFVVKTDQKQADQKQPDQKQPDQKQADQKQADQKQADQKQADQKQADQKQADQKQPDQKQPDQKQPDQKITEKALRDSVVFEPVKEAMAGKKLKLQLQVKQTAEGPEVTFAYRLKGASTYLKAPMSKSGINYFVDFDDKLLTPGAVIEYYFIITLPDSGLEIGYPAAGEEPFTLTVPGKDAGKDADKNADKDKPKGRDDKNR
jgi:hypothetical protein